MIHDFRDKGGGGFNPFGFLSTLAAMVPGGQAFAPWLAGAGAVTSAAQGDWAGAAKQATGIFGGGSSAKPAPGPITEATPMEQAAGLKDYLRDANSATQPGFVDNLLGRPGGGNGLLDDDKRRYDELLVRYGLSDMDWTTRQKRSRLTTGGGI